MNNIHPTALINPGAKLGANLTVGPFAYIEEDVVIGDDCFIGPNACLYNGTRIGNRVKIFQGASVANRPQDLKFNDSAKTTFEIGDDTTIREFATLHRGTEQLGFSKIGKNCLLMAYTHVAHDCVVGDNCILANCVQLGGHATIEDWVIIGGGTPVHQFSLVGQHAMVGGGYRVVTDVPPYVLAAGEPMKFSGLNVIGLRRRGFTNQQITDLKEAYNIIFRKGMNLSQAKEKINETFADNEVVKNIIGFFNKSKRPLIKG